MEDITVVKLDHAGREVFAYRGRVLTRRETCVQLEAFFGRDDVDVNGVILRRGDRFLEWFYSDRWYNIFEIHDVDDDRVKGWYCNVTRPAVLGAGAVRADDLALDLLVTPDGGYTVLDQDEFQALPISAEERKTALAALDTLIEAVHSKAPPFNAIRET